MDVMRVAGLSMASAVVALVLRRLRPEIGLAAALAAGMLVLGNVAFVIYDILLGRVGDLYVMRLRPKLFPRHVP